MDNEALAKKLHDAFNTATGYRYMPWTKGDKDGWRAVASWVQDNVVLVTCQTCSKVLRQGESYCEYCVSEEDGKGCAECGAELVCPDCPTGLVV